MHRIWTIASADSTLLVLLVDRETLVFTTAVENHMAPNSGQLGQPRRAVITGLGVVAPNGVGRDAFWEALAAGKSGIRPITRFDPAPFPTRIAGQIDDFHPTDFITAKRAKHMDRTSHYGVSAARMAADDASLDVSKEDVDRIGVMFGTTLGVYDYDFILANHTMYEGGRTWDGTDPRVGLMAFPEACASQISMELGIYGPSLTFAETCSSALDSLGHAYKAIRYGELDVVFAGGAQAPISQPLVSAFCMLRGMSTQNDEPTTASRPFDKERDGFVMGEGAGILVIEEMEHALRRGVRIYGEIIGYAATCDAYHMTNPRPDGRDAARAVRLAIKDAGIDPTEIDYVNAHGTSTPLNDKTETKVLKDTLGDHANTIPVSSVKSMIGHLIGASASVEVVASCLALEHQVLPPTINLHNPDPECDLDYVPNTARPAKIRTILKNSFGFGGKNSALILRAAA